MGLWLALVVLVGLNLRPFLTAVGPLATRIASETRLDFQAMAWLTLLPMLMMGLGAFFGAGLSQILGPRRAVLGALAALAAGSALRAHVPNGATLIATAALCGLGVAVVQEAATAVSRSGSPWASRPWASPASPSFPSTAPSFGPFPWEPAWVAVSPCSWWSPSSTSRIPERPER